MLGFIITDSGWTSVFHIVFFVLNHFGQSLSADSILTDFPPMLVEAAGGERGSSGLCWHLCSSFWDFLARVLLSSCPFCELCFGPAYSTSCVNPCLHLLPVCWSMSECVCAGHPEPRGHLRWLVTGWLAGLVQAHPWSVCVETKAKVAYLSWIKNKQKPCKGWVPPWETLFWKVPDGPCCVVVLLGVARLVDLLISL